MPHQTVADADVLHKLLNQRYTDAPIGTIRCGACRHLLCRAAIDAQCHRFRLAKDETVA
jgi:hypothetical protein